MTLAGHEAPPLIRMGTPDPYSPPRYDSGDAVSKEEYTPEFPFSSGRIVKVVYDVGKDGYVDVERKFAAALSRD